MIKTGNFVHLHNHTEYSLLDGSTKISELMPRVAKLGMDAIAITDHGVMYGVVEFYKTAVEHGIKPILGCEVYVANTNRFDTDGSNKDNFYYHLVLLAENDEGYHNIIKIVSAGFTDGFYYKPRVDEEILRKYSKGVIALSACVSGVVTKNLLERGYDAAKDYAVKYADIFGSNNFFIEVQDHGLPDQLRANPNLIRIADELGLGLVLTNDSHYLYEDDAKAHEILLCVQTNKTINDPDRMIYEGGQFYVKSPAEMAALIKSRPDAIENTVKIAERCSVEIKFHEYKLPKFELPKDTTGEAYLRSLAFAGLEERYALVTPELSGRLDYEIGVITSMGFVDYFLVVWDFIRYARENDIPVGPGRGSGAGCLAAYCLKITNVDPIKYSLIFERFLNPERISMPDFDIDFCYERRQEVIDYVIEKYGADHVSQIITFGTMAARSVIRDVARALAFTYNEADKIAKMVPFALNITLDKALEISAELKETVESDPRVAELIEYSKRLEGLPRHASTHAAGVVICDKPVSEYVPLGKNDDVITTQFPMTTVEELGLLKMDFLGLRTLTVIKQTTEEIRRSKGQNIDMDAIDYEDAKVYDMISKADTEGVFQLESSGMKSFMRELAPSRLEDIIAGISLYRPGPMDFIPKYVAGKNSAGTVKYTHSSLEPILKETYGCIVYQEQVMQIVRDLAGYSWGRSDLVRRAMSKKKADVMRAERQKFVFGGDGVAGCVNNGVPVDAAEKIFDEMTGFAQYAFNKSHAAAYAVVCYQTAWLKYHYPVEYMAALLTSCGGFTEKITEYIQECRKIGITLSPPDINEGFAGFTVSSGARAIRFGLSAIKNVGYGAIAAIVGERESGGKFKSLTDFISRLDDSRINKRCLESLIRSGAFDSLGGKRSQYLDVYEKLLSGAAADKKRNIQGQMSLFDEIEPTSLKDVLPNMPELSLKFKLADEKTVMGIYVSGHPVLEFEDEIKRLNTKTSADFIAKKDEESGEAVSVNVRDGEEVTVAGIIAAKSVKYTKAENKAMAFVTIEDLAGSVETIVFPKIFDKYAAQLNDGVGIAVKGRASVREDEDAKVVCDSIAFLGGAKKEGGGKKLWLKIPKEMEKPPYAAITAAITKYRGDNRVVIYDEKTEKRTLAEITADAERAELLLVLKGLLGDGAVAVK